MSPSPSKLQSPEGSTQIIPETVHWLFVLFPGFLPLVNYMNSLRERGVACYGYMYMYLHLPVMYVYYTSRKLSIQNFHRRTTDI